MSIAKIFESMGNWWPNIFGIILIAVSILLAGGFVIISSQRPLSSLEHVLFQLFIILIGQSGSFLFGRASARKAAAELIKPHAKSAFRRLMALYRSLSRVAVEIESVSKPNGKSPSIILERLDAIVIEQLVTADAALEDWSDIVPEDVAELKKTLRPHDLTNNA